MDSEPNDPTFEFKFESQSESNANNEIPATVLATTLNGFQRVVHLLAMDHLQVETRERDRSTREIEKRFTVLCSVPQKGSYLVPVRIGGDQDLLNPTDLSAVSSKFKNVVNAISTKNTQELQKQIPDRVRRFRTIEAIRTMVPKKTTGYSCNISNGTNTTFFESKSVALGIQSVLSSKQTQETVRVITGRLSGIDFDSRILSLLYPPTLRVLDCHYTDEVEELLLENPRELIQVTGKLILDEKSIPLRIVEVNDIQEVDLSPLVISEVKSASRTIRFNEKRVFEPFLDDQQQLYCIQDNTLGIDVYAYTRTELEESLSDQIEFLWDCYASESDSNLTPDAQELSKNLRDFLSVEGM